MDITRSVVSERDRALLSGDYAAYHAQTTRKIHTIRKRLGITTPKGRKYSPKAAVTADNVAQNAEWIQLLLTTSERAWAEAMSMKTSQSQETTQKPMAGSTKRQIASRLRRAITHAQNLVMVVQDSSTTGSTAIDQLEAKAYLSLLKGGLEFEKTKWDACVQNYAVARIIYATLGSSAKTDIYKDLLSSTVDPSIRYAAYQLKMPRTKPVPEIVVASYPRSEDAVRAEVEKLDANAFVTASESTENADTKDQPRDVPTTISWRSRKVKLEDAAISQALGLANEYENFLADKFILVDEGKLEAKDLLSVYEDIITTRQDAADAAKSAIDELTAEGVDPGDSRMQSLQITRTAINYGVIEWRIGRNRVLCGAQDGLTFEPAKQSRPLKTQKDGTPRIAKEESSGRKISRLRERTALYESILQSLNAVKELPGVIADTAFVEELDAKRSYFRALKCLAIGRSYAVNSQIANALALYSRALELVQSSSQKLPSSQQQQTSPSASASASAPKLELSSSQLKTTISHLTNLVIQYRALADLKSITSNSIPNKSTGAVETKPQFKRPFIETLHHNQFSETIDLTNLVNYPPKLQPIPVKPLFFDLAWNYIQYPGQTKPTTVNGGAAAAGGIAATVSSAAKAVANAAPAAVTNPLAKTDEERPATPDLQKKNRGWFGFGRS